jgi:hypothetical protein
MFRFEMGLPMMAAVGVGVVLVFRGRPLFGAGFNRTVIAATSLVGTAALLASPEMPFYRQFSGLQMCFALLVAIAVEPLLRLRRPFPLLCAVCVCTVIAVPASRSAEAYAAHQGLGRALHVAAAAAPADRRWFAFEKYRPGGNGLRNFGSAGSRIRSLPPDGVVVTDFPVLANDPYMLGVLAATPPVAAFPTEWCTAEEYAELAVYFNFERFADQPERCEARVYAVSALQATMGSRPIEPVYASADSQIAPRYGPRHAVDPVAPLWVSAASIVRPHFVELLFSQARPLGRVAVVAPEPYFGGGRIDELTVSASSSAIDSLHPVWHASALGRRAVFVVPLAGAIRRIRFTVDAQNGQKPPLYGGIRQLVFAGIRFGVVH